MIPADQKPYDTMLIVRRDRSGDGNEAVATKTLEAGLSELVAIEQGRGLRTRMRRLLGPDRRWSFQTEDRNRTAVRMRHGTAWHEAVLKNESCGFAHVEITLTIPTTIGDAHVRALWVDAANWRLMPNHADPLAGMTDLIMFALKALGTPERGEDARFLTALANLSPNDGRVRHVAFPFGPAVHFGNQGLVPVHSRIPVKAMTLKIRWTAGDNPEIVMGPCGPGPCEDAMEIMRSTVVLQDLLKTLPEASVRP